MILIILQVSQSQQIYTPLDPVHTTKTPTAPKPLIYRCCLLRAGSQVEEFQSLEMLLSTFEGCKQYLDDVNLTEVSYVRNLIDTLYTLEYDASCEVSYEPNCKTPTTSWYMVYMTLLFIIFLTAFSGNAAVLFVYFKSPALRLKVTGVFITSLASSDLLVVIFLVPIKLSQAIHNHEFCAPKSICQLFYTTDVLLFTASITTVFGVTIDRYVAIQNPFNYKDIVTFFRARLAVLFIWVYAGLWSAFVHFDTSTRHFDNVQLSKNRCQHRNNTCFYALYFVVFLVPCVLMGIMYIKIHNVSSGHAKHIKSQCRLGEIAPISTITPTDKHNKIVKFKKKKGESVRLMVDSIYSNMQRKEWKVTKMVMCVYGLFVICWLPLVIIFILQNILNILLPSIYIQMIFVEVLPLLNCIINPVIYSAKHKDFKIALKRMMFRFHANSSQQWWRSTTKRKLTSVATEESMKHVTKVTQTERNDNEENVGTHL